MNNKYVYIVILVALSAIIILVALWSAKDNEEGNIPIETPEIIEKKPMTKKETKDLLKKMAPSKKLTVEEQDNQLELLSKMSPKNTKKEKIDEEKQIRTLEQMK
jgi:hypothetical protein